MAAYFRAFCVQKVSLCVYVKGVGGGKSGGWTAGSRYVSSASGAMGKKECARTQHKEQVGQTASTDREAADGRGREVNGGGMTERRISSKSCGMTCRMVKQLYWTKQNCLLYTALLTHKHTQPSALHLDSLISLIVRMQTPLSCCTIPLKTPLSRAA